MIDLQKERLLELLADRTVFGLDEKESMELKKIKKEFPDWDNDLSLELAAAAIGLSTLETEEQLPNHLQMKIFASADKYFETHESSQKVLSFTPKSGINAGSEATGKVRNIVETITSPWQWLGWAFAAAACIALAFTLLTTRSNNTPEIVKTPETIQTPQTELSVEQKRERLLASAADTVTIPLTNPKNGKEIVGDMVWSNAEQKGYARFTNLPVNEASKESYQLWIVDETQDAKTPISGGVFDINKTGEVIVPVNAQIQVRKPKMIAVTVEKSGGVVVSKQEKVVALAKI